MIEFSFVKGQTSFTILDIENYSDCILLFYNFIVCTLNEITPKKINDSIK